MTDSETRRMRSVLCSCGDALTRIKENADELNAVLKGIDKITKKFCFCCDVEKGSDELNGDIAALVGVFENCDLAPAIVARRPIRGGENIVIVATWYDGAVDKFNALSLQDRFYFETVDDFLTACEKYSR